MEDLGLKLKEFLKNKLIHVQTKTQYREPLVGFVAASDPGFQKLKEVVTPHHLLPQDILPQAQTVVAFFLPFTKETVSANRRTAAVAREWGQAYVETNKLINELCQEIGNFFQNFGYETAWQPATHNFNPETLEAFWSHRSVAYLAGLGSFGVNRMLITPAGCAGRFGSVVTSAPISPSPKHAEEFCSHKKGGKCGYCVQNCPTGALTFDGIDKQKCYSHLLKVAEEMSDIGLCDVCGKCSLGPCALG